jgi:2-polyprenyl-3-methyl-5-hydroxy-6-metoxy-1,4-benzoquinol methylase/glycosyltransferase involved in cell wall biosynthesis
MDIIIAAGGMPFGPTTTKHKSLGGSETAAWQLAEELVKFKHNVTIFAQLPEPGEPDFIEPGEMYNGVRWAPLDAYEHTVQTIPHDLLIAQRDPRFVAIQTQSRKKVLWCHDIATHCGMQVAFDQTQFAFDEVWAVSEWHRQQIHKVTGYPLENIVALRNGIVRLSEDMYDFLGDIERNPKQLFYAARPERGLISLIRPGGIMSHLPDVTLKIAMYEHFPEHMADFYNQIFQWMEMAPNVEFLGGLSQEDMRLQLRKSVAYVYPTGFQETSCIIAREAMETKTPFLTTKIGALPETLGESGVYFEDWQGIDDPDWEPDYNDNEFCAQFAGFIVASLTEDENADKTWAAVNHMARRDDLYWDGVAEMVNKHIYPNQPKLFSQVWSMVQDGDIIPAEALITHHQEQGTSTKRVDELKEELHDLYDFVFGDKTMEEHYKFIYDSTNNDELEFTTAYHSHLRIDEVKAACKTLPAGSRVIEYGCGAGHMLAPLAEMFPDIEFIGIDISQDCVDVINEGGKERGFTNIRAYRGDEDNQQDELKGTADLVYCSEVLEHVIKPWEVMDLVESYAKKGGYAIYTVPYGPWEPMTFKRRGEWRFRAHIWEINKVAIAHLIEDKEDKAISAGCIGVAGDGRAYGNYIFSYKVDHEPVPALDPLEKAQYHFTRETIAAAVIAYNNEHSILRMLDSLGDKVQRVKIALGPCTDNTPTIIQTWAVRHPYVRVEVVDVPKILPPKKYGGEGDGFGFDDARNISVDSLDEDFDWVLWIDTDEYLVGDFRPFLRANSLDSYLVTQHHFTVEPRGEPAQLDRPARIIRTTSGFKCLGHIHEHFEVPEGGPGRGFMLPNVDIGHTGYENEETRRRRFQRNFPFLEWDHETGGERRLHAFLWFRDIVHRVRYCLMSGNQKEAFDLANEGIEYYNENWQAMASFGPGAFQALDYVAELNGYLDKGLGVRLSIGLEDGRTIDFKTQLEDYDQLERILKEVLGPEYEKRRSRYY